MKTAMGECNEKGFQQRIEPNEEMIVLTTWVAWRTRALCWRDLGYNYLQYTRIELLDPWCHSFRPHNDRADVVTRRVLFRVDA
jgi:hypothetical protein